MGLFNKLKIRKKKKGLSTNAFVKSTEEEKIQEISNVCSDDTQSTMTPDLLSTMMSESDSSPDKNCFDDTKNSRTCSRYDNEIDLFFSDRNDEELDKYLSDDSIVINKYPSSKCGMFNDACSTSSQESDDSDSSLLLMCKVFGCVSKDDDDENKKSHSRALENVQKKRVRMIKAKGI